MEEIRNNAIKAAKILDEKKGIDVTLYDVKGKIPYTDYLIISTGMSERHVGALSNNLRKELSKANIKVKHSEGNSESGWLLLDYIDFVVHIFSKEKREFYNIDRFCEESSKIDIDNKN